MTEEEPKEIKVSRLWLMDWETREVRMYEEGEPLQMLPVIREIRGDDPFKIPEPRFEYARLWGLPSLPAEWISISLFGQDYDNEHRPWFAVPKLDRNFLTDFWRNPVPEWRTVRAKIDGVHFYYGVDNPPDAGRVPMADRWEGA